jgi:hypothetical protein
LYNFISPECKKSYWKDSLRLPINSTWRGEKVLNLLNEVKVKRVPNRSAEKEFILVQTFLENSNLHEFNETFLKKKYSHVYNTFNESFTKPSFKALKYLPEEEYENYRKDIFTQTCAVKESSLNQINRALQFTRRKNSL